MFGFGFVGSILCSCTPSVKPLGGDVLTRLRQFCMVLVKFRSRFESLVMSVFRWGVGVGYFLTVLAVTFLMLLVTFWSPGWVLMVSGHIYGDVLMVS